MIRFSISYHLDRDLIKTLPEKLTKTLFRCITIQYFKGIPSKSLDWLLKLLPLF